MREIIEEEEEEKFKPLNDNKINEEKKVEIVVRTVGPARPSCLQVPSSIKVHDLRKLIAGNNHLPIENLRLILRGNVLRDSKNGDDAYLQLSNGDSLIVAVKPKPPVKNLRDGLDDDDDDDEDLKFQLPQSSSRWKRRLYFFLHDKLKLPGKILATGFVIILLNLGKRQPGDVSAYSIFNEDFRELPGTLNADRLDRDVRSGQF
ncbi:Ubiquitin domain containing protein [Parasponia andersonii]|uniref:Ubiquitin domain containing protein n=1 Tax=Parasponia andersonii TaxID=3476 RepID=A0A2P5C7N1_PARAD|nr:Ubiquitin domain containing protein [Parasponia andersonii]